MRVMNWTKIKTEYPEAWNIFKNWLDNNHEMKQKVVFGISMNMYSYCNDHRSLFDFFDENEIYITIGHNILSFYWCVSYGEQIQEQFITDQYETIRHRQKAEILAFEKAFEILNNKLK